MRGHRRRDAAEERDTLLVEPFGDDAPVDDDVELGGGTIRPLTVVGAVVAFVVLGMIAVSLFSREDEVSPAPTTTSVAAPSTTDPAPTEADEVSPASQRAITFRVGQTPIVDTNEPWQLYLRTAGTGALYRIDVTTGWAVPVEDTTGQVYKVLPGVTEPVVVDGSRAAKRPESWVAGSSGRVWVPGDTGNSVDLVEITDGGDVLVSTVTIGPQERLIGSTADGDPVISGPNARQYVARAGGERVQLAEGLVSFVEHGSFAELSCDAAQQCAIRAHGAAVDAPVELPYRANRGYRFSPTGTHVAALDADHFDVVDLRTGTSVVAIDAPMAGSQRADAPAEVAWTPDGGIATATMADGTLLVVDVVAGTARALELPEALALGVPLAVL